MMPRALRFALSRSQSHDRQDFTSADVAFSSGLATDAHPCGRDTFANATEVRTPDLLTAEVALALPAPNRHRDRRAHRGMNC
jgi:hypothetical protein